MTAPVFELWKSKGLWYCRVRAGNGQILMTSEGYEDKRDATRCIALVYNAVQAQEVKF